MPSPITWFMHHFICFLDILLTLLTFLLTYTQSHTQTVNDFLSPSFAYIEFHDRDSVQTAMSLDETVFRDRVIKVSRNGNLNSKLKTLDLMKLHIH